MADAALAVVGVAGVGTMGGPMCRRLLTAGYRVVAFNRTASRLAPYLEAGAEAAPCVAALAATADVILTCLDTVAASESVYLDADGLVAHARAGTLLIDHGTIRPALALRVAERAAVRAVGYVDAPVSGGPEGAEQGTLAVMVGGSARDFARALPFVRAYGRTVVHMGSAGAGTHAKLVNQLLTFVHGAVAAEAIALAERLGLNLGALGEVIGGGFGQSRMFERTLARVRAGQYEPGAALRLYDKDLGIVAEVGAGANMQLPLADAARRVLRTAMELGLGERDLAALHLRYPAREADE